MNKTHHQPPQQPQSLADNPRPSLIDDRYQVLQPIGRGGMGDVYRVQDYLTGDIVALKQVNRLSQAASPALSASMSAALRSDGAFDSDWRLRFATEYRIVSSLHHPNVISVLDYGFDAERQPFFTMPLLTDARPITDAARDLPHHAQALLLLDLLQGLAYVHRRGVLHRDLKPANVLVTGEGVIKVVDFGLAQAGRIETTGPDDEHEVVGTLAYLAPEVLQGQPASEQSDLYAVGMIAYEIFTGAYPLPQDNLPALVMHILHTMPDIDLLPDDVAPVIETLLQKDPTKRYISADAALDALQDALNMPRRETAAVRDSYLQAAPFVGRQREYALLRGALDQITTYYQQSYPDGPPDNALDQWTMPPPGAVFFISGESGVGKSRLLEEVRTYALTQGVLVLNAQGVMGGGIPYQLWVDIVRRLALSSQLSDAEAAILKSLVPDIDALLGRSIPYGLPLNERGGLGRLVNLLERMLRRQTRPVLLLLDDVHDLMGSESLTVLQHLLPTLRDLPCLVVVTYRHDEAPDLEQAFDGVHKMRLNRLNADATRELCAAMLGKPGSNNEVVALVQRESEGNAFLMVEVVRTLAEQAGHRRDIAAMTLPQTVPSAGAQALIRRRLGRMPDWSHPILQRAAIHDRQLDTRMLRATIDALSSTHRLPDDALPAFLLAGSDAAVLELFDGRWRFAHDKLRETLLHDTPDDLLPLLHRDVAQAIATAYPRDRRFSQALAHHWQQAGDPHQYVYHAIDAAIVLNEVGRFAEARDLMQIAYEIVRNDISMEARLRARTLGQLGSTYASINLNKEAHHAYFQGLMIAEGFGHDDLLPSFLIGLCNVNLRTGDVDTAYPYAERALALAQALQQTTIIGMCLNNLTIINQYRGAYDEAIAQAEQAIALSEEHGHNVGTARHNLALTYAMRGDYDTALHHFQQTLTESQQRQDRRTESNTYINMGNIYAERAQYEQARQYYQMAFDLNAEMLNESGMAGVHMDFAELDLLTGDLSDAMRHIDQAAATFHRLDNQRELVKLYALRTRIHLAQARTTQAKDDLRQSVNLAASMTTISVKISVLIAAIDYGIAAGLHAHAAHWAGCALHQMGAYESQRKSVRQFLPALQSTLGTPGMQSALNAGAGYDLNAVLDHLRQMVQGDGE